MVWHPLPLLQKRLRPVSQISIVPTIHPRGARVQGAKVEARRIPIKKAICVPDEAAVLAEAATAQSAGAAFRGWDTTRFRGEVGCAALFGDVDFHEFLAFPGRGIVRDADSGLIVVSRYSRSTET